MKPTGRLHIYPPAGPKQTGYIVADRNALKGLADAAKSVAAGGFGFETLKLYSADGHEYELVLTTNVTEDEWQNIESQYGKNLAPDVGTIHDYNQLKQELIKS